MDIRCGEEKRRATEQQRKFVASTSTMAWGAFVAHLAFYSMQVNLKKLYCLQKVKKKAAVYSFLIGS